MKNDELKKALEEVNNAINSRFEKNILMYIPITEKEILKKFFCNQNFYPLLDRLRSRKLTAEALTKFILKNAWMIEENSNIRPLLKIIEQTDNYVLYSLLEEYIFTEKVDINKYFRNECLIKFFEQADPDKCKYFIEQESNYKYPFMYNSKVYCSAVNKYLQQFSGITKYQKFKQIFIHESASLKLADPKSCKLIIFNKEDLDDDVINKIYDENFITESSTYIFWRNVIEKTNNIKKILDIFIKNIKPNSKNLKKQWYCIKPLVTGDEADYFVSNVMNPINNSLNNIDKRLIYLICNHLPNNSTNIQKFKESFGNIYKKIDDDEDNLESIINNIKDGNLNEWKMIKLTAIFHNNFHKNYEDNLNKIYEELKNCGHEKRISKFLVKLVCNKDKNRVDYLLYTIDNINENRYNYDNTDIVELLNHIEKYGFINKPYIKGCDKIKSFVAHNDLNRYRKITKGG